MQRASGVRHRGDGADSAECARSVVSVRWLLEALAIGYLLVSASATASASGLVLTDFPWQIDLRDGASKPLFLPFRGGAWPPSVPATVLPSGDLLQVGGPADVSQSFTLWRIAPSGAVSFVGYSPAAIYASGVVADGDDALVFIADNQLVRLDLISLEEEVLSEEFEVGSLGVARNSSGDFLVTEPFSLASFDGVEITRIHSELPDDLLYYPTYVAPIGSQRAIVSARDGLVSVDLPSGAQTLLNDDHGFGWPVVHRRGSELLALSDVADQIGRVDADSGVEIEVFVPSGVADAAWTELLVRPDGDRAVIAGFSQGDTWGWYELDLDSKAARPIVLVPPFGGRGIAVSNSGVLFGASPFGVFRVDEPTGSITEVSRGGSLLEIRDIEVSAGGDEIYALVQSDEVVGVDTSTGSQRIIATGSSFAFPRRLRRDRDGGILVIGGVGIWRVDPLSGSVATVVERNLSDGDAVNLPSDAVHLGEDRYLIADIDGIVLLDAADQEVVFESAEYEEGWNESSSLLVTPDGSHLVDLEGRLVELDLATGISRTAASFPCCQGDKLVFTPAIQWAPEPAAFGGAAAGILALAAVRRLPRQLHRPSATGKSSDAMDDRGVF